MITKHAADHDVITDERARRILRTCDALIADAFGTTASYALVLVHDAEDPDDDPHICISSDMKRTTCAGLFDLIARDYARRYGFELPNIDTDLRLISDANELRSR